MYLNSLPQRLKLRQNLLLLQHNRLQISKQYCRNYQTNNCRRTNCKYLHEIDPSSKSITKDDKSDNRSVKPASSNNRSLNYKSNNSNKRNNNRANDNNNSASMSNSNSGPSHARLNKRMTSSHGQMLIHKDTGMHQSRRYRSNISVFTKRQQ